MISEISPYNEFLDDEDNQDPDWIELMNVTTGTVNLSGWYLTDADDNLTKWTIPAVSLSSGEMVVIFASGKDRTDPAGELHTNFKLSEEGEYLALVRPDGVTIEDEFDAYPETPMDMTYGRAFGGIDTLVPLGAHVDIHIPTDGSLGTTWTSDAFSTSAPNWFSGQTAVGYFTTPTLQVAGDLLVDLDASGLSAGSLSTWTNNGTLGTQFASIGTGDPTVETVDGAVAVSFDGDDAMSLDALVPESISGTESWSMEAWVYNPSFSEYEVMVSCWHCDQNGSGMFSYGYHGSWGVFTAWSNDLGCDVIPPSKQWHHLVLTNEGGLGGYMRIYVDGKQDNIRQMVVSLRDVSEAIPVMLGMSTTDTGLSASANYGIGLSASLARVRIHSEELTADQVLLNYEREKNEFTGVPVTGFQQAGNLLVVLDAADATAGSSSWANSGTLGGTFAEVGNDVVKETVDGMPAVTFDGISGYQGPNSITDIEDASDRTIEVWAWNPAAKDQETMVSWAYLGTNLRHMVFGYGSHGSWGAVANWGAGDMPWNGLPEMGTWHHLTYVYDGAVSSIYVDGELDNSMGMALDTRNNRPIMLGCQTDTNGVSITYAQSAELSIGRIRVHGGALTPAQVKANYIDERDEFGYVAPEEAETIYTTDVSTEMYGVNSGAYLRIPFTIDGDPSLLYTIMRLKMIYDDGFVAYLNGTEIASRNAPVSVAYDSTATTSVSAMSLEDLTTETIVVSEYVGLLQSGLNVLAIHGLNSSATDYDFFIQPELSAATFETSPSWYLSEPTPGEFNGYHVPGILDINHSPNQPATTETCKITADIDDPDGIVSVTLSYQVVSPGSYIPAYLPLDHDTLQYYPDTPNEVNPDYVNPANWTTVTMYDDGTNGDVTPFNGKYTAILPVQSTNRTLVRYRITVTNGVGVSVTAPYPLDPSLNCAYYVYDGVPAYTVDSSVEFGGSHTYSQEVMNSLPVYHLISRNEDIEECNAWDSQYELDSNNTGLTYIAARRKENWFGTFVYDDVVYDNICYRLRGTNARYLLDGKRSWKIVFNRGNEFQARDIYGKKYPTKWRKLLIGKMFSNLQGWWWNTSVAPIPYSDFGLAEAMGNKMFNLYGVPAPFTHWMHFRVVDGANEAPDQYYGDFWGMFLA
ncbi:lamin tail domain-containing protein, partial [Candidatus Sumerlaeota bacterium]|nr:lamin tail domain-containing protein [Candidatus Sumerlaeota bacterium]